jgi:hypothetical protein
VYRSEQVRGNLKTIDDQVLFGGGPTRASIGSPGRVYVYSNVKPWRSIFDSDAANSVAPYPGGRNTTLQFLLGFQTRDKLRAEGTLTSRRHHEPPDLREHIVALTLRAGALRDVSRDDYWRLADGPEYGDVVGRMHAI